MIAETDPLPEKRFNDAWLDKPLTRWWSSFTVEKLLIVLIIVLALVTRFPSVPNRLAQLPLPVNCHQTPLPTS